MEKSVGTTVGNARAKEMWEQCSAESSQLQPTLGEWGTGPSFLGCHLIAGHRHPHSLLQVWVLLGRKEKPGDWDKQEAANYPEVHPQRMDKGLLCQNILDMNRSRNNVK